MEEVARDQGPDLPAWFRVKPPSGWKLRNAHNSWRPGRGARLLAGRWSRTWPLTSGKVLSRPLEVPVTAPPGATSCGTWRAPLTSAGWLDAGETPGGPEGRGRASVLKAALSPCPHGPVFPGIP